MKPDRGSTGRIERPEDDAGEWEDLTRELQAAQEAEDRALREQDQRELDEQQYLDGEDRCLMLD